MIKMMFLLQSNSVNIKLINVYMLIMKTDQIVKPLNAKLFNLNVHPL